MKTLGLKMMMLFFLMVGGTAVMAQDPDSYRDRQQDVPGDDFSLEGALELFKQSASPEEFERKLNLRESRVNNLDLNGDGDIDYIRVIDRNEGNVHAFIMQAVLSSTEAQDVAVIELEKLANGKAVLQITGDEDVYGIETIIEPTEEVRVNAGTSTARNVVNVWTWPSVQYVYSPYYTVWVSPWHWYYRPVWWYSWRPIGYYDYYSYWYPYRSYYSPCHTHRVVYAQTIYRPHRTCSSVYYRRHESRIVNYRSTHRDHRGYNGDRYVDHNKRNHHDRTQYNYDRDRNRGTSYTDDRSGDRTSRSRYEGKREYNTAEHKPVVRERSSLKENERSTVNMPVQRKQNIDRKPAMMSSEPAFTSRPEVRNKPVVERSSPTVSGRTSTVNTSKSLPQRESRSFDRSDNKGRSSGVGEVNKSKGNENGKGGRKR